MTRSGFETKQRIWNQKRVLEGPSDLVMSSPNLDMSFPQLWELGETKSPPPWKTGEKEIVKIDFRSIQDGGQCQNCAQIGINLIPISRSGLYWK